LTASAGLGSADLDLVAACVMQTDNARAADGLRRFPG
jgi:hypothetical protein